MDDPLRVGVVKGPRHLGREAQGVRPFHGLAPGALLGQRPAFEVLEGDVERPRGLVASHVVHDHDPRMLEGPGRARLRQEPLLEGLALPGGDLEGEADRLQGHSPAQSRVNRLADHPHHAAAELAADLIAAEGLGNGVAQAGLIRGAEPERR